ncbi:sigma-B regulation protein RsbU (phosphoserine phosphatase) [Breoghania corrubedonensis]|uniref:Sigma-B regulation protein RsbU (Phosphoserine phosphatase) n=1 Tax=Breoghania corrubedonensis TaxID=665038 RepID=A0A2T5UUA0_9HYPH|nr:fused response regulator/phosphatase [Breoghania corrubedonensis]PTW55062.1 sigma-B regulation protein RsbU (phosphoserine phosphatase) [Breoghania corrubedonensis]
MRRDREGFDEAQSHRFSDNLGFELKNSRILIVDDTLTVRAVIAGYLRNYGYVNLREACDGAEGLDIAHEWAPDLIITDLMMPRIDGFELCHRLHSSPETANVPILVQTALNKSEERSAVFSAGAADLISKPIDPQELLGRVRTHLEKRRLIARLSDFQRRMENELALARTMQESILPEDDELAAISARYGVTLASHYEASIGLGGDLWGLSPIDDDRLAVFSADFSGHGVGAALNTFRLHSFIVGGAVKAGSPAEWLSQLNVFFYDLLPAGQFATVFCAFIDFARNTFDYASAGAPPPLLNSPDTAGSFQSLDSAGYPIGLLSGARYENATCAFPPGSTLFLYSDALIETPEPPNAVFTTHSLCEFLQSMSAGATPQEQKEKVLNHLRKTGMEKPEDDLTIVILKSRSAAP